MKTNFSINGKAVKTVENINTLVSIEDELSSFPTLDNLVVNTEQIISSEALNDYASAIYQIGAGVGNGIKTGTNAYKNSDTYKVLDKIIFIIQKIWDYIINFFKKFIRFIQDFINSSVIKSTAKKLSEALKNTDESKIDWNKKIDIEKYIIDSKASEVDLSNYEKELDKIHKDIQNIARPNFMQVTRSSIITGGAVATVGLAVGGGIQTVGVALGAIGVGIIGKKISDFIQMRKESQYTVPTTVGETLGSLGVMPNKRSCLEYLSRYSVSNEYKTVVEARKRALEAEKISSKEAKTAYITKDGRHGPEAVELERLIMESYKLETMVQNEIVNIATKKIKIIFKAISAICEG